MTSFIGVWPLLSDIGLSADALVARRDCIGGSDANTLMSGDPQALIRLWQEKRGEAEGEDLSGVLQVQLGCWTETFNRQWFTKQTGHAVEEAGRTLRCPENPWRGASLDGFVPSLDAIWEAKHTSAFAKSEEILARYMPQLQHNMAVRGVNKAVLSVIYGNHKWETVTVDADWMYQEQLLDAERRFWDCVQSGTTPCDLPAVASPIPAIREADMSKSNSWVSHAADWLTHKAAAKKHETATKELKALVEADVFRAFGAGLEIKRSKAGALTIKEAA